MPATRAKSSGGVMSLKCTFISSPSRAVSFGASSTLSGFGVLGAVGLGRFLAPLPVLSVLPEALSSCPSSEVPSCPAVAEVSPDSFEG